MHAVTEYISPVGILTLAEKDGQLAGLWIAGQRFFAATLPGDARRGSTPLLRETAAWLDAYFAGKRPDPTQLPLAPEGSAFRQRVWRELLRIPYGVCVSYGDIARTVGSSPRAVGGAVGRNPISVVIPCHRVVGADGSIAGYAGGQEAKIWLLRHEGWMQPEENI